MCCIINNVLSQIKLIPFKNGSHFRYESIVFQYVNEVDLIVNDTFDIEKNNPLYREDELLDSRGTEVISKEKITVIIYKRGEKYVLILNNRGQIIKEFCSLTYDSYAIDVTANGHFLIAAYGAYYPHMVDTPQAGFRLYDLRDETLYLDQEVTSYKGTFSLHGLIAASVSLDDLAYIFLIDDNGSVYFTQNKGLVSIAKFKFRTDKGDTITKRDLQVLIE